jgi:hypothetical protein
VAARDRVFADELSRTLELEHTLAISVSDAQSGIVLSATGQLPAGLTTSMMEDVLGTAVDLRWRGSPGNDEVEPEVRLAVPRLDAERVAARRLGAAPLSDWGTLGHEGLRARLSALSVSAPRSFRTPDVRSLRLYGALLGQRFAQGGTPGEWQRVLAAGLGLDIARVRGAFDGWALFEREGADRRGSPTLLQRARAQPEGPGLLLTLAAPRWLSGGTAAAARLTTALDADALLVHGALVSSAPDGSADPRLVQGRQSYFQRAVETWLNAGGRSILLRGIAPDRPVDVDAVVSYDTEVRQLTDGHAWALPLLSSLQTAGVSVGAVDGTAERAGLEASRDPGVGYARRFAPDRSLVLWLSSRLRARWAQAATRAATRNRLERLGLPRHVGDLALLLAADCARLAAGADCVASARVLPGCERAQALEMLERYQRTQNPHFLESALARGVPCGWRSLALAGGETTWLAVPPAGDRAAAGALGVEPAPPPPGLLLIPLSGAEPETEPSRERWPRVTGAELERLQAIALWPLELETP